MRLSGILIISLISLGLAGLWVAVLVRPRYIQAIQAAQRSQGPQGKANYTGAWELVVLSHRFPTAADPVKGIYVQKQLEAIRTLADIKMTIISPVPYAPKLLWFNKKWQAYGREQKAGNFHGHPVYYPRYVAIPGAPFFFLQGLGMFLSSYRLVKQISRITPG